MSAHILWNDNLPPGRRTSIRSTRSCFERINKLLATFNSGTFNRQEFSSIIQFLTDYVVLHFGNEESYMAKYAYSSACQHKAQHEQFVKAFMKLKDRMMLEGVNPQLAEETKQLLVDWLINHIKYSDRALGMFLKLKM